MKYPESVEPFLAIRTRREYGAAVARLNALVDEVGDNPKDPRYRLIETVSMTALRDDKRGAVAE
jgi:hypothetical protein